jgi:hypothetical protein
MVDELEAEDEGSYGNDGERVVEPLFVQVFIQLPRIQRLENSSKGVSP